MERIRAGVLQFYIHPVTRLDQVRDQIEALEEARRRQQVPSGHRRFLRDAA